MAARAAGPSFQLLQRLSFAFQMPNSTAVPPCVQASSLVLDVCLLCNCTHGAPSLARLDHSTLAWRLQLAEMMAQMFSQTKQQTTGLWMWRMEYLHHEQRPLYFGEWF
ncbi:hypothetical protein T484DRAFT_1893356 [Baffinella frigidus]|nr:hypothetical protein T484DRAFT_1893356 [Cryptophyta sp. CCMP2293]